MSVGDVSSAARGSGARFNDGKPDLSLVPIETLAASFGQLGVVPEALREIGRFQVTGEVAHIRAALHYLKDGWRDCARVFMYGREKYAAWNWSKGMAWSIPIACAARHGLAILEGEKDDPESGLPHIGHLMCNLVMLEVFTRSYPEGNDLPPADYFKVRA